MIDALVERVTVAAYGDHEQQSAFWQWFEDEARFPFRAVVVGAEVDVVGVDVTGDERRGLVAICRRDGANHRVSLVDVVPGGPMPVLTRQLLDAYRRWSGVDPLPRPARGPSGAWRYRRLSSVEVEVSEPLALRGRGSSDPAEEYWGEPGDELPAMWEEVIEAGARPCFEMEQILPGVDPDDWDTDPIVDAADLHRAGHHRSARRLLEDLVSQDPRCIDAWGHLGLIAFDTQGPGPARRFYETGIAVAEVSVPDGFDGVLAWGWVDNRPFLRCLHGLGLCAWRQRRWDDAEAAFTARVWLDPTGSGAALACLDNVRRRHRWSRG
ncbi:MAG: hypothetical protein AMXMBFR46_26010 [Acidimicrobiia bacterium]